MLTRLQTDGITDDAVTTAKINVDIVTKTAANGSAALPVFATEPEPVWS